MSVRKETVKTSVCIMRCTSSHGPDTIAIDLRMPDRRRARIEMSLEAFAQAVTARVVEGCDLTLYFPNVETKQ